MKKKTIWALLAAFFMITGSVSAQKVSPTASYTDDKGFIQTVTSITDGQAPLTVTFRANPEDMEGHSASYEWHFRKMDANKGDKTLFVRYEEDTEYTFSESGNYNIILKTVIDGDIELDSSAITIFVADSWLEFPNAFSPNGDGINDIYKAKKDYKSIVSFHAFIINRWGQKLFEWTDPDKGWDGTYHGKDVKEGTYFVIVKARGADGKQYDIKKDVNLLRSIIDGGTTGGQQ